MVDVSITIVLLVIFSTAGYYTGKEIARQEICENSGGVFVENKCYTGMIEKKLEFKND